MKIHAAVREIINPAIQAQYSCGFELKQVVESIPASCGSENRHSRCERSRMGGPGANHAAAL